jgi:ribosome-binding factor A
MECGLAVKGYNDIKPLDKIEVYDVQMETESLMAGGQRLKRMADSVQRELSELIRQELKDPRLGGLVTISGVKVSPDLGYADVYVTVMGRELVMSKMKSLIRKR